MKKVLALILALALVLTVFAGCNAAPSSEAGGSSAPAGGSSAPASGKQLTGKVVYWSMYNEGEPEAMAIQ